MALDSATARLLGQLAEGDGKPLHECTPDEARALGSKLAELAGPAPAMQRGEECTIEGPDGQASGYSLRAAGGNALYAASKAGEWNRTSRWHWIGVGTIFR